jgi:hypothetical protein
MTLMQRLKIDRLILVLAALVVLSIALALLFSGRATPEPARQRSEPDLAVQLIRPATQARFHPATVPETEAPANSNDQTAALLALELPREKIEDYLRLHHRDAASLLAAFHASLFVRGPDGNLMNEVGDMGYLKEAATNFPNDPHVQFTVLAHDVFPEERDHWLAVFRASAPGNSLANYLSAEELFRNNQPEAAVQELLAASGKPEFNDYGMESLLGVKELYLSSGKTPLESDRAGLSGMAEDTLPELASLKRIAQDIAALQQQYRDIRDAGSVENLIQFGTGLADRLTTGNGGKLFISRLVGIAAEAIILQTLDPDTHYASLGGQTPVQRLAELKQQKTVLKDLAKNFDSAYPNMSEAETVSYYERARIYGEVQAKRWVQQQHGGTTPNSGN